MKNIIVTGANGFVGKTLCATLVEKGYFVRGIVRSRNSLEAVPSGVVSIVAGDIGENVDWQNIVKNIDIVIHLAARVHIIHKSKVNRLPEFMKINSAGTKKLAEAAAGAGVKKFIYMSSIKVNGEITHGRPFFAEDLPVTKDPYGVSKWKAEEAVREVCSNSGMNGAIVRPTLVYGPGVGGNFLRLLNWVRKGIPLPLGAIENKRSFVYLGNLVDAISALVEDTAVHNETFLISDGKDVATPDLIKMIARAMGSKVRLMRVAPGILKRVGSLIGRVEEVQRLTESLCVDNSKICNMLKWNPPFAFEDGIKKTVEWYMRGKN